MENNIVLYVVRSLAYHYKLEISLLNHLLICLQRRIIRRIRTITINAPTLVSPLFQIQKATAMYLKYSLILFTFPFLSQKKCVAPNGATHCKTHNSICCYTNFWTCYLQEERMPKWSVCGFAEAKRNSL